MIDCSRYILLDELAAVEVSSIRHTLHEPTCSPRSGNWVNEDRQFAKEIEQGPR